MLALQMFRRYRLTLALACVLALGAALAPAAVSAQDKSLYVVAVGIRNAKGQPALHATAKDAQDMARWASSQRNRLFAQVHVTTLIDNNATRSNILRALQALRAKARPGDYVIFYGSSHGGVSGTGEFNFIAYDRGVSWSDITAALQDVPGRKIVILDACHSGAAARAASRTGSMVVFASSRADQLSFDGADRGNSLFTLHFLAGLYGRADFNRDGRVTLQEAASYADARLKEADRGKAAKNQQNVVWSLPRGVSADLSLAKVSAR